MPLSLYTTITVIGGTALYLMNHWKPSVKDKLATSEIKGPEELKNITGTDGLKITENIQLKLKYCYEGLCIIGPTGENKTTSEFFPNLLDETVPRNVSLVVMDPKAELYKATAHYQKSLGRDVILFAPLNPENSLKYNPLEQCKDITEVRELAQSLLLNGALALEITTGRKSGDTEWINMATPLFAAALLYCKGKGKPLNTIAEAFRLIVNNSIDNLDALFSNSREDVKVQYNIFKSSLESPRTASSIKVTFASNLQIFSDPKLIEVTRCTEFNASQLRKKPTALYIMYPERKANYLSPFMSCFFNQLINKTLDYYTDGSLPVIYMWDEFANIGLLNNFSQVVATARSREVGFMVCLQSATQLCQVYGKDNAKIILNNLKTKVVLPSLSDIETINMISELCGYTEITTETSSRSSNAAGTSSSSTTSKTRRKLLEPDEIRRIPKGKALIIAHNLQPVIDTQNIYYTKKIYNDNVYPVDLPFA